MKQLVIDVDTYSCNHFQILATDYALALESEFRSNYALRVNFPKNISHAIFDIAVSRVGVNKVSESEIEMDAIHNRIRLVFNKLIGV